MDNRVHQRYRVVVDGRLEFVLSLFMQKEVGTEEKTHGNTSTDCSCSQQSTLQPYKDRQRVEPTDLLKTKSRTEEIIKLARDFAWTTAAAPRSSRNTSSSAIQQIGRLIVAWISMYTYTQKGYNLYSFIGLPDPAQFEIFCAKSNRSDARLGRNLKFKLVITSE